jgi:hypothetical protein
MNKSVDNMNTEKNCPCGGGQSCIVDRRFVGDFVHEDDLFNESKLPLRKNCYTKFTKEQYEKIKHFF